MSKITIPKKREELLAYPEFALPIDLKNIQLLLPEKYLHEIIIDRALTVSNDACIMKIASIRDGKIPKQYMDTFDIEKQNMHDECLPYYNRLIKLKKSIRKDGENLFKTADLMADLHQRIELMSIIKNFYENDSDLVPLILYYASLTFLLLIAGNDRNNAVFNDAQLVEIIEAWGCGFLIKGANKENYFDEYSPEQMHDIIEQMRKYTANNLLAYVYLLNTIPMAEAQQTLEGQMYLRKIIVKTIDSNKPADDSNIKDYVGAFKEGTIETCVDNVKQLIFLTNVMEYLDDASLKDYAELYQKESKYFSKICKGEMSVMDIIRLKNLEILKEEEVKDLFNQLMHAYNTSKEKNKFPFISFVGLYLGNFGAEERLSPIEDIDYDKYKEWMERGLINQDMVINALKKGWITPKNVIKLVADGCIEKELFVKTVKNNAPDLLKGVPNYKDSDEYEIALLAYAMGVKSKNDVHDYINNQMYLPPITNDTLIKISNLIGDDFSRISTLVTSDILDYNSTMKIIQYSNESGFITFQQRAFLNSEVFEYRITQLDNITTDNQPENPNANNTHNNHHGNKVRPRDRVQSHLCIDPEKFLEFLAAINDPQNPNPGNIKRIIIDGYNEKIEKDEFGNDVIDPKTGEPKKKKEKSSLDGYELIPLAEAGVSVLKKMYKTKRVEYRDGSGEIQHRMEYIKDSEGNPIPDIGNNAVYIISLEMALDFSGRFNKSDLIRSPYCRKRNNTGGLAEGIKSAIFEIMSMRKTYEERLNNVYPIEPLHSLPIENIEKSRRKIIEAVKMYSQRIKDNYREFMIQRN